MNSATTPVLKAHGINGFGMRFAEVAFELKTRHGAESAVYSGSLSDDGTLYVSRLGAGYGYTVHPGIQPGTVTPLVPADVQEMLWQGVQA